jgi:hypothetical protein
MALVDRVKNILLSPRAEWQVIDAEPATVSSLYAGYIAPLAAIPAVCGAIGLAVFGYSIPIVGGTYRVPITTALTNAVVSFVFQLVGVYIFAFIVDALAPSFGGTKNMVQALKLAAYSATPVWILGVLSLFPGLTSLLGLVGVLYMLYLFFIGLPVCMKAPQDKVIGYAAVSIIAMIIVVVVLGAVAGLLGVGIGGMGGMRGMPAYRP